MRPDELPELIRPLVRLYGPRNVQRVSLSALGFPAVMVTTSSEVREILETLGREPCN